MKTQLNAMATGMLQHHFVHYVVLIKQIAKVLYVEEYGTALQMYVIIAQTIKDNALYGK